MRSCSNGRLPLVNWGRLRRDERDAAYNNSEAVPEAAKLNAERAEASAAWRLAAERARLDVPYAAGERNRFDLFPAADPRAPCLVFIHGGYWQRNGREGFSVLAQGVRARGWSAAMPSHTLAPDASLAAIVAEIGAALDWLALEGSAYGVSGKLYLAGWSAGAHLAAMWLGHPAVVAGLAISGVFELGPLRDTYLDEKLRLSDEEIATCSPLRLPVIAKPLVIAYGSAELPALVEDSRALHRLRAAAHAPGVLVPLTDADHFTVLDALRRPEGVLVRQLLALREE